MPEAHSVFDYLEWRGDLSFESDPLNEIDSLIFCSISYLNFNTKSGKAHKCAMSLEKICRYYRKHMVDYANVLGNRFFVQLQELLLGAASTKRFSEVEVSHHTDILDEEHAKQFSATVFSINPKLHYIAFRGTDNTITGWKEDFRMSFLNEVPAQKQAVSYFINISADLKGHFLLGGHSKGGNLAAYAAANSGANLLSRIIRVYNNDGPGFLPGIAKSAGYQDILEKLVVIVPESSVVGMLLEHPGKHKIVSSSEIGIMQHNPLSWGIRGNSFVEVKKLSYSSIAISKTVRSWMKQVSLEQRAEFVEVLFSGIESTGVKTLNDLTREKINLVASMFKTYTHLDKNTRTHLNRILWLLVRETGKTFNRSLRTEFSAIFSRKKEPKVLPAEDPILLLEDASSPQRLCLPELVTDESHY